MSPEMELGMKGTVKIVNFIQSSDLNKFFENLYVYHTHIFFFYSAVRWLSKGKVVNPMYVE